MAPLLLKVVTDGLENFSRDCLEDVFLVVDLGQLTAFQTLICKWNFWGLVKNADSDPQVQGETSDSLFLMSSQMMPMLILLCETQSE